MLTYRVLTCMEDFLQNALLRISMASFYIVPICIHKWVPKGALLLSIRMQLSHTSCILVLPEHEFPDPSSTHAMFHA